MTTVVWDYNGDSKRTDKMIAAGEKLFLKYCKKHKLVPEEHYYMLDLSDPAGPKYIIKEGSDASSAILIQYSVDDKTDPDTTDI